MVASINRYRYQFIHMAWVAAAALLIPSIGQSQADQTQTDRTQTDNKQPSFVEGFGKDILADFRQHYSWRPLGKVAIGMGVAGVIANTDADAKIQDFFNEDLSGSAGDDLAEFFTTVGDVAHPLYAFPIYLGAMWLGGYNGESESAVARWGANSMRAVLVGTPEVVVLSKAIGGHRPEQGDPGWYPFEDDAGVSGHAFLGAVPIISAARLTNKRWLKYTLYATSTLPGLARVYDDKHYFSQALLGWWIAYVSAETVANTNIANRSGIQIMPVAYDDGGGVHLTFVF